MLTFDNLAYIRNSKKIFSDLSFSISIGSVLVLRGKNGTGKSSLLKIIAGFANASSGHIKWEDENINDFREEFNRDCQFLNHQNFFHPEMSVIDNLKLFTRLYNSTILIPAALKTFELEEIANVKIKKLSLGWQRKVILSKLICCPGTLWLLDEPSIGLDKKSRHNLKDLIITKVKDGHGMVILATHDDLFYDLGPNLNLEDFK